MRGGLDALELTEELAHVPLILRPDVVYSRWNAEYEHEDIRCTEIGEEVVGEMLEILVFQDDENHDEVAHETRDEHEHVDHGEEYQRAQGLTGLTVRVGLGGERRIRHGHIILRTRERKNETGRENERERERDREE